MKQHTVIGSKTLVTFPKEKIFDVPAKVDTGADSSSIWASDIQEVDGTLYFTLFGPKSPYYTGKVIKTTKFTQSRVKNSFGHSEPRYKVQLSAEIEGVKVRVSFTLADRSRNEYPILVGRRTLKNRFLVDVTRSATTDQPRKVLIVTSKLTKRIQSFCEEIERFGDNLNVTCIDYADFIVRFVNNEMTVTIQSTGEDLAEYDIVHFKTSETRDITASLARYCTAHGTKILDPAILNFPTTSKLYEYTILVNEGIRVPDTIFATPKRLDSLYSVIVEEFAAPFVLKGVHVSKGEHNYLIHNEVDYREALQKAAVEQVYVVAQKFIPNNSDYRILLFGQTIELVIERIRANNKTHLNNTSQGGNAKLWDIDHLPEEVRHDALRAAAIMERDVTGVDMLQNSETGEWYCLEVNDGPQIASGAFLEEKERAFAEFINRRLA